jgi:hypothetical protein
MDGDGRRRGGRAAAATTVKFLFGNLRLRAGKATQQALKNGSASPIKTLNVSPVRPRWVK